MRSFWVHDCIGRAGPDSWRNVSPLTVPKYQAPLVIPPVMPKAGPIIDMMGKNVDYYGILMKQFRQQILRRGYRRRLCGGIGEGGDVQKKQITEEWWDLEAVNQH